MALAGIELRYLVDTVSGQAAGYYVSNIYGITRDSLLFKLHHTEKPDLFLMVSPAGFWPTSVKISQIEPNRLQKRLRNDILRLKLERIRQEGAERVAYFDFAGFGKEFVLVAEFFKDGNIILCDDKMKILALQHSVDVRHRQLKVGLEYAPPPQNGIDIFGVGRKDFDGLAQTDIISARWLGRTLGLPRRYAEGILGMAQVKPDAKGSSLGGTQLQAIHDATLKVVRDVTQGDHSPVIVRGQDAEVLPLSLGEEKGDRVGSFVEGLDQIFTESLLEHGKTVRNAGQEKAILDVETQISEQERAIETVKAKSSAITTAANSLYTMVSQGMASIRDPGSEQILAGCGARLVSEKGVSYIEVAGSKIRTDYGLSLQSIASTLFDEAKHQARAVGSIEQARDRARARLTALRAKEDSQDGRDAVTEIRKKAWYERYRWFYTSDGLLAVGGRDAASNSAVIRKQMARDDKIFHAEIFGSPFFILKDAADPPALSINEVAHATVCFSRAWREGLYGTSAYWVGPDQVKKSAPSGEFLPKGSFTIEGQRNFVKAQALRLAVGVIPQDGAGVITCGPVEPVKKRSAMYVVIEPQGSEMAEAAKRVRTEFLKLDEQAARGIQLDDIVRAMPAGKSQIKHAGLGDAAP